MDNGRFGGIQARCQRLPVYICLFIKHRRRFERFAWIAFGLNIYVFTNITNIYVFTTNIYVFTNITNICSIQHGALTPGLNRGHDNLMHFHALGHSRRKRTRGNGRTNVPHRQSSTTRSKRVETTRRARDESRDFEDVAGCDRV